MKKKIARRVVAEREAAGSPGVEKRAAAWLVELRNKVVRLDLKVFGRQ